MFKMKKLLSMVLAVGMIASMSTSAFALEDDSKSKIIDHVIQVNQSMGINMTPYEIAKFKNSLETSIAMQAMKRDTTENDIYKQYLQELQQEVDMDDLTTNFSRGSGDDIGDTPLPTSVKGNIFFVDNNMPYNHVGIYTSSSYIVESMPKDGTRYWSITNEESYQSPVSGSNNDSCILKVNTTDTNKSNAASWSKHADRLGTPYDYDFLDNKSDYYYINHGTQECPNYVKYLESDAYNCSELVWKAYKKNGNVNLDSNGGLAVYPNNIYNSSKTSIVSYWGNHN